MAARDLDYYLSLVTSEHRQKPRFRALISALLQQSADVQEMLLALFDQFDLDTAIATQLDTIGLWIGIGREIVVPLDHVYFSWDDLATIGWDAGSWQGPDDPDSGIISLDDASYRVLLRAKIAANNWDGTVPAALAAYLLVFPEQEMVIVDNQDMTQDIIFIGPPLTAVERALILRDLLLLRPVTVQSHVHQLPDDRPPDKWLAWDAYPDPLTWDDPTLGWGVGNWTSMTSDADRFAGWGEGWWFKPRDFVFAWDTMDAHMRGWGEGYWAPLGEVFGWDTESFYIAGWGAGDWERPLLPNV